jgi:nitrogen fixation/metabolism regulation signal transduction histidine kinase
VLALDEHYALRACNPAATQVLGVALMPGQALADLAQSQGTLALLAQSILAQKSDTDWQQQIELTGGQVLLVRGSRLPAVNEISRDSGFVVVFDDITKLMQAQRDAAWGEVARRLAHEIKNPLTPIQLSAERLEHKLTSKLDAADARVLQRATHTIVTQVTALKSMVNEFSEYARSPALNLAELDFNELLREVLALYEPPGISMHIDVPNTPFRLEGDATMLRQILHNLLQNAQDALEDVKQAAIHVSSRLHEGCIRLMIRDNGSGFPEDMIARVFEPYVTTKRHGTGLGLAIVKKIVEEHHGTIYIKNHPDGGAEISLSLPAMKEESL